MTRNCKRLKGVTVFGAIGIALPGMVFQLAKSTNTDDFIRFLKFLRSKSGVSRDKTLYLVIDNHSAHKSERALDAMERLSFREVFMPTYSPEFNCIETLWGVTKKRVREKLLHSTHELDKADFNALLKNVHRKVDWDLCDKIATTANRDYIYQHLSKSKPDLK